MCVSDSVSGGLEETAEFPAATAIDLEATSRTGIWQKHTRLRHCFTPRVRQKTCNCHNRLDTLTWGEIFEPNVVSNDNILRYLLVESCQNTPE